MILNRISDNVPEARNTMTGGSIHFDFKRELNCRCRCCCCCCEKNSQDQSDLVLPES